MLDKETRLKRHQRCVEEMQRQLIDKQKKGNQEPLSLLKGEHLSNTIRDNSYKKPQAQLAIGKLSNILDIDQEKQIAWVEPRVTMEQLVKEALASGLVPLVVPEFKGITVGGAIMGAALESSSHLFGQFNDICTAYEVLLGDGSIVRTTASENSDLFYGISGSYGSLGIILSVELRLKPASKWVKVSYSYFTSIAEATKGMQKLHRIKNPPEYIEALVLSEDQTVVISGKMTETPQNKFSLNHFWSPWFYQHVKKVSQSHPQGYEEDIPIADYLFRYDRGAFWMGAYALHGSMLARYFLDMLGICPGWFRKWQSSKDPSQYGRLKYPGIIFRSLFGWAMGSRRLYSLLHFHTEKWFADRFVIQDFYVPEDKTAVFTEEVINRYQIFPIWLCPIKPAKTPQILAPHYDKEDEEGLFFDVGVYGFPLGVKEAISATKHLEKLTQIFGGRKMLYSYSYYSKDEFWEIYPKDIYHGLRQKYHGKKAWLEITEKVLVSD